MSHWSDVCPDDVRLSLAQVHPSWAEVIDAGLAAVHGTNPDYLPGLKSSAYLPEQGRLFAAFSMPMDSVRYILVGEGPYPRADSATGYCFMDGAVKNLWSDEEGGGLSKKVNRATSLRNFMKMLLVAAGELQVDATTGNAMAAIAEKARHPDSDFIQTLAALQSNMMAQGFLLLNASLVFRADTAPVKDARAWQPFLEQLLSKLLQQRQHEHTSMPSLVLWGKIAEQLRQMPVVNSYPQISAEHPYNLSFIANQIMQDFFRPMNLLAK
ncbi:uracil-DNA glycosylase [Undibacterium sp. Ji50W]|uniref:uracil-DNA glycosylase n=1 Tax=Undibacterium sp. Ji50W TaxID=3413041 RepID=UPI003BF010EA